jgi:Na+-driven multidrug efflux pump
MNPLNMIFQSIKGFFRVFRGAFMPNKKDFIGSLILSIPLYVLFGLSLVFLLPLIIAGVIVVYFIRRLWRIIVIFWTVRVLKRRVEKDFGRIKKILE